MGSLKKRNALPRLRAAARALAPRGENERGFLNVGSVVVRALDARLSVAASKNRGRLLPSPVGKYEQRCAERIHKGRQNHFDREVSTTPTISATAITAPGINSSSGGIFTSRGRSASRSKPTPAWIAIRPRWGVLQVRFSMFSGLGNSPCPRLPQCQCLQSIQS